MTFKLSSKTTIAQELNLASDKAPPTARKSSDVVRILSHRWYSMRLPKSALRHRYTLDRRKKYGLVMGFSLRGSTYGSNQFTEGYEIRPDEQK